MPITAKSEPRYKSQDCALTLAQALDEFYARNPDAIRNTGSSLKDNFFRAHDTIHVVFGCDTTIRDEVLADFWTIFGSDLGVRNYLKFLKPLQDDLTAIVSQAGRGALFVQTLKALPLVPLVYWRTRKMRRKWHWGANETLAERPLGALRKELNICVIA